MDQVYPNLFISGTIKDYTELQKNNITHVINLKNEEQDTISILSDMNIAYYYIPINDWGQPRKGQIETLIRIWKSLPNHHNVLIHCATGRGRAASMAMAIMMYEGLLSEAAIKEIKDARPIVTMLPNQIEKVVKTMKDIK